MYLETAEAAAAVAPQGSDEAHDLDVPVVHDLDVEAALSSAHATAAAL